MAFESLTEKLQNVFKMLRAKGTLTEKDVHEAMKEVKMALLEADVNFKVVKKFTKDVEAQAIGENVMSGLNPGQMVIKIVNEKMIELMGSDMQEIPVKPNGMTVLMMAGLQGAGKTTTAAKLAGKYKKNGKRPLLIAADVYRPAAIKQLQVNGEKVGVPVFTMGDRKNPVDIVKAGIAHAQENGNNMVLIDTAGRLQIDESMMQELCNIKAAVDVDATILVVDAMMGEKLSDLEQFYPDRMASRILGMGDILSLIEKAQEGIDEKKAAEMNEKLRKAQFGFDDYLDSLNQMRQMGGIESILSMLPGMNTKMKEISGMVDEKALHRTESIIFSMTPEERSNPDILNLSRKRRIAKGSGVDINEVNRLVKQFEQTRKMMKQMPGMMGGGKPGRMGGLFGKRGGFRMPF